MKIKLLMIKTIAKLINSVIILVNTELLHIEILNIKIIAYLKYSIAKQISMVFYNELNYDYYFIIKELRKKIEGEFNCLGENTETSKTFSVPIIK